MESTQPDANAHVLAWDAGRYAKIPFQCLTLCLMTAIYYHVNRSTSVAGDGLLAPGDALVTDARPRNHYFEGVMDFHRYYRNEKMQVEPVPLMHFLGTTVWHRHIKQNVETTMGRLGHIVHSHLQAIREQAFELVRMEQFPHLPSRTRCLWVCGTEDEARSWLKELKNDQDEFQILRLEVGEGVKLHAANDGHILQAYESDHHLTQSAQAYWRGEATEGGLTEILLEGSARVLDVVTT